MQEPILRKLFLGFVNIHILHHAHKEPFFGAWMIEELKGHGYEISAGTLYPILHNMEKLGLLQVESRKVKGKIRKYYSITEEGGLVLEQARMQARELLGEIEKAGGSAGST
ncbi:PadR family transcriptional regulator [Anaerotalea alkaliphila]|uniref:Helix-turn-helix transcriptional regulator n=1 Tax=Anaerotalea alkaliphila TaxID=2662126 RepID=A0A7X5KNV6_9FIRM|nr:PadR family transcriptional regulator [Anaerotalea alkaliphila]NDL67157.1 helix-turn-helix transcriptional regulator [Anaerotalea alkaliphila]